MQISFDFFVARCSKINKPLGFQGFAAKFELIKKKIT